MSIYKNKFYLIGEYADSTTDKFSTETFIHKCIYDQALICALYCI